MEILCSISTRGRYFTTLPSTLFAIINQTKLPDHIILFDDNDPSERLDLRDHEIYKHIFTLMNIKKISWEVIYGECKGQHFNHQKANLYGFKYVWRVDDDVIPEPNVLQNLYNIISSDETVGAVAGSIICPLWNNDLNNPPNSTGKIEDIYTEPNLQWFNIKEYKEVDHLHCSFIYRAGIANYNLNLSKIAHREESIFTYELKQKGYKNVIIPNAVSYHLKSSEGGIRDGAKELYYHDEEIFRKYIDFGFLAVLNNGIGDQLVFSTLLPELIKKHDKVTVATSFKNIYIEYNNIKLIPLEVAAQIVNIEDYCIYKKMAQWNWSDTLQKAFRKLYDLNSTIC